MPQSLSNFDAALKDNYGPGLQNAVNNANPVLSEIPVDDTSIIGRKAVWTVHTAGSASTGARAELGTLPTADRQRYISVNDDLVFNYHTVKVSGPAIHLTRGDEGAFVRALESELDGAEKDIKRDRARQLFGQAKTDGTNLQTGVIATLSADPGTGTTLTVATATRAELRAITTGMRLDIINPSGGGARTVPSGGHTVVSVDLSAKTIEVADAVDAGVASGDYVVRYGNFGKEINGLRHLISTDKYAGIDPSSTPIWGANAAGSSTTPVSEVLFEEASEIVMTEGDGDEPNLFVIEYDQRRKLASQLQAQKRYDAAQTTLPSGWKGLTIAQGTLVADRYCPSNDGFGLTTKDLKRFVGLDWTWDDDDRPGQYLYKALDDSDAVQARFKVYDNFEAVNRNSHVRITFSTPVF